MGVNRKRLKRKRRSCALCKPHKTGGAARWTNHDLAALDAWEAERCEWEHGAIADEMWPPVDGEDEDA